MLTTSRQRRRARCAARGRGGGSRGAPRGSATMDLRYSTWPPRRGRHPHRHQPAAAAGRPQRRLRRPRAERGRRPARLPRRPRDLLSLGDEAGTAEAREQGRLANEHHPVLTPYDRYGNRVDEVEFHPAWHWLMERAVGHGLAAAPGSSRRTATARPPPPRGRVHGLVAHRARARLPDLDDVRRGAGAACGRRAGQGVDAAAGLHDVRPRAAAAAEKLGVLCGMGMTEKQGGSDVRANVTGRGRPQPTASTPCTATSGSPRRR